MRLEQTMIRQPDPPERQRERPDAKHVPARGLFGCKVAEARPAKERSIFPLLTPDRAM
jgi:hypothetical protein